MNSNRTAAFHTRDCRPYALLRWCVQQHVYMIRHRIASLQFYAFLSAQISQYLSYPTPKLSVHDFLTALRQNYRMILVFPSHICLSLPFFHNGFPWLSGAFAVGGRLSYLRFERQSSFNSHRQSWWIIHDLINRHKPLPPGVIP
jgi:hypothetical protein